MKSKFLSVLIILISFHVHARNKIDTIQSHKIDSLTKEISLSKKRVSLLQSEISSVNQLIKSIKDDNSKQLEFYRDTQSGISWTVNIFIVVIGGAFALLGYLFKRPDEIWKKINETEKRAQIILNDADRLLDRMDFQYKNQESIFILNKKSLFHYSEEDWNMVQIYSKNALKLEEKLRTSNDWIFMGLSAYRKADLDSSIYAFKKATEKSPRHEIAWKHLGNAYAKNLETENAIAAFKKVIAINPNNDIAFNNLGTEYATLENYDEAERNYLKAIRINPSSSFAYYTNYFELNLVHNLPFDMNLQETFLEKFENDKNAMASFNMLHIYKKIVCEEMLDLKDDLNTWRNKYGTVGWDESYRDIEKWIVKMPEKKFEKDLMQALNFFSSDAGFQNYS